MSKQLIALPHLLLIDDDEEELTILSDALEGAGIDCQCTWAMGSLHGLKILKYFEPQFIFIDYNMPRLNGIECIAEIRKAGAFDDIPIIFYSSEVSSDLESKAKAAGAFACVKKTGSKKELIAALRELFMEKQLAARLHLDIQ